MSTSSTVSVTLIQTGENCQRTIIFTKELTRGQTFTPVFTNGDIIVGLVYEHMNVDPVVVQKLDAKATLLVFQEGEEIEKRCSTLQSIEM